MKRTIIIVTAALCLGAPGVATAGDTTADLEQQVEHLTQQLDIAQDRLDHKADVLACERAKRRTLERSLRTGAPVGFVVRCR